MTQRRVTAEQLTRHSYSGEGHPRKVATRARVDVRRSSRIWPDNPPVSLALALLSSGRSLVPPAFLREGTETIHPPRPSLWEVVEVRPPFPPSRFLGGLSGPLRNGNRKNIGACATPFFDVDDTILGPVHELNNKILRDLTHPLTFPQLSTSSDRPKTKAQYMVYGRLTTSLQRRILNR